MSSAYASEGVLLGKGVYWTPRYWTKKDLEILLCEFCCQNCWIPIGSLEYYAGFSVCLMIIYPLVVICLWLLYVPMGKYRFSIRLLKGFLEVFEIIIESLSSVKVIRVDMFSAAPAPLLQPNMFGVMWKWCGLACLIRLSIVLQMFRYWTKSIIWVLWVWA